MAPPSFGHPENSPVAVRRQKSGEKWGNILASGGKWGYSLVQRVEPSASPAGSKREETKPHWGLEMEGQCL
ncbi:MAG: hypothetical protein RLZZ254_841 [Actinomycetota bacterium]|jgi:hypothetical protein